jgi:hypothetical protein
LSPNSDVEVASAEARHGGSGPVLRQTAAGDGAADAVSASEATTAAAKTPQTRVHRFMLSPLDVDAAARAANAGAD